MAAIGAALVLATLFALVASLWLESHYPGDDGRRALLPALQKFVTRPVVEAVGRQVAKRVQEKAAARMMLGDLTLEETIARFLDETRDLTQRRLYAYRLARVSNPACVAALLRVLEHAPAEHKAFMAQLIGSTGNPVAKNWLRPLLQDADESVRLAAIRGLSSVGGDDVRQELASLLHDEHQNRRMRTEAAAGLGALGTPAARDELTAALARTSSRDLALEILHGLARFPFASVADTFAHYVAQPAAPADRRAAAIEALAQTSSDATPFLLEVASHDREPEVRAAAAWALSSHDSVTTLGPAIARLLETEPADSVRQRLYEALVVQDDVPLPGLIRRVRTETDPAVRVAGCNAFGSGLNRQPGSPWTMAFDLEMVPELTRIASEPNSLNLRIRAVFALRRARTPAAVGALQQLAGLEQPQVASAARNGLRPPGG